MHRWTAVRRAWEAYRKASRVQNLSTHAVGIFQRMRHALDHRHGAESRPFIATVDGSYTNKTVLKGLPERTTLIGRIRKDAKLFHPPSHEDQPAVGAKRQYGHQAPTPEQLRQDDSVP